MKRIMLFGVFGLIVAQQIFAYGMTAVYGHHCTLPDKHWWGQYQICWANWP